MALAALGGLLASGLSVLGSNAQTEQQQAWNEEMWKKNNEYNTPVNQMKRLRAAHINPHFALSGGQLGTGVSSTPASSVTPQPYDFSPINQGLERSQALFQEKRVQDAEIGLKNSEAQNFRLRNVTQLYRDLIEVRKMAKDSDLSDQQRKNLKAEEHRIWIDIQSQAERNEVEIERIRSEQYLNNALERESRLKSDFQSIVNQFEIPNRKKILRNLDAQYENILASAAAGNASAAASYADAALKGVEKGTAERLRRHIVAKAFQEVEAIKDEREIRWIQENRQERGEGKRLPSAVGTYETSRSYYRTRQQNRR